MSTYNVWAIKCLETNELLKRHVFAKDKRGHDDEVDRIATFKSRKHANKAKRIALSKVGKCKVVKAWADVQERPDDAEKDLSIG